MGKVQNVIPGMQAAFIDIGYQINAFLPFTDIIDKDSIQDSSWTTPSKTTFSAVASVANVTFFVI